VLEEGMGPPTTQITVDVWTKGPKYQCAISAFERLAVTAAADWLA